MFVNYKVGQVLALRNAEACQDRKDMEEKLNKQAKGYNENYPGQTFHGDTKRLPLIERESSRRAREYLSVGLDDFSRELYAAILPDKT